MEGGVRITSGSVLHYRLYDVAWGIDLTKVEAMVKDFKRLGIERRLFSRAFEFANPPLTIRLGSFEAELAGRTYHVNAFGKVYDLGLASIILEVPVEGAGFDEYAALARHLRDRDPLGGKTVELRDALVRDLGGAMTKVEVSQVEEDYTVYYIRGAEPAGTADEFLRAADVGALMLAEEGELPPGASTLRDLFANRLSYSDRDLVLINWDNALVLDPSGSMDIPDLLEYANAHLLELRVYDRMLDRELDSVYERIGGKAARPVWRVRRYSELAAGVMRMVTELTEITERVDNSLKVTDDVYYARVYSAALALFKVKGWEEDIKRKLDIAARVYDMLYREISNRRAELLELAIVVLIVLEIVLFMFMDFG